MAFGDPYGHLAVNGRPLSHAKIARMTGIGEGEFVALYTELKDAGVPSETEDGTIFSRRMVRDNDLPRVRSKAGKKGAENRWGKRPATRRTRKPKTVDTLDPMANSMAKGMANTMAKHGTASALASASALDLPVLSEPAFIDPHLATGIDLRNEEEQPPRASLVDCVRDLMELEDENGRRGALIGAWIAANFQNGERPPREMVGKQAKFAQRLAAQYDGETLARIVFGISRVFPYSQGEAWDLKVLGDKAAQALAASATGGARAKSLAERNLEAIMNARLG